MTRDELIANLGNLDARLFSTEFTDFLLSLEPEPRKDLNHLRKRIGVLYNGLTNNRLRAIEEHLAALADDWITARNDVNAALDELADAAKIAQTVARIAGIAEKVVLAV